MTAADPEATSLSPAEIASQRFSLTRKGYDCGQVDAFLRKVAEHVDRLGGELEWQRTRCEHLEHRTTAAQEAAYSRIGRDFTEVVRALEESIGRIRAEAEAEARKRVLAAHQEADRIVAAARREAGVILRPASGGSSGRGRRGVLRIPEAERPGLISAADDTDA